MFSKNQKMYIQPMKKIYLKNTPHNYTLLKEHFGEPRFDFFNQRYLYFCPATKEWGAEFAFTWSYMSDESLSCAKSVVEKFAN